MLVTILWDRINSLLIPITHFTLICQTFDWIAMRCSLGRKIPGQLWGRTCCKVHSDRQQHFHRESHWDSSRQVLCYLLNLCHSHPSTLQLCPCGYHLHWNSKYWKWSDLVLMWVHLPLFGSLIWPYHCDLWLWTPCPMTKFGEYKSSSSRDMNFHLVLFFFLVTFGPMTDSGTERGSLAKSWQ